MTPCDICSRPPSRPSWRGAAASKPAARTPAGPIAGSRAAASELVNYQRNGGFAATLDTVRVRIDGARSDKRYGGAGRRSTTSA